MNMHQRGFSIVVVLFAIVALSLAGGTIVLLSSTNSQLAGQFRRQVQVESCADAGIETSIARLPQTSQLNFQLDPAYSAAAGHYAATGSLQPSTGILPPTLAANLPLREAGNNIANVWDARQVGLGSGAADVTRQPYRFVTTCTAAAGQKSEAEKIILYGGGR